MKLSTRFVAVLALMAVTLAPSMAANIIVEVGDNFYRGPDGTSTIRMATSDVLTFQYIGALSHPTASDDAKWQTFQMNAATPTKVFNAGNFVPGTYPFHCEAHGAAGGIGQAGTLIVSGTLSAKLDARSAGVVLSVYPNPSRGQVTVQVNQRAGQDYKLRLSNIIGQEIRTIALKPELTTTGLPVDLTDLHAGVYFYSLLVDGKVVATKRLVLQN